MKKESWGSRMGLILAMAGNAVGFGNFLRFPVQAIENGGGAFLIPYLICFFLMGIPLVLMEWAMGRLGGKNGNHSTPFMMHTLGKGKKIWKYIGGIGLFSNLVILSYYSYIESWTISYTVDSIRGAFSGKSELEVANFFKDYVGFDFSNILLNKSLFFYVICLLLNIYVISKGIGGIEKISKFAMPVLLLFASILAIKGWTLGTTGASEDHPDADSMAALNFLWHPDFSTIWSPKVWLAAAGQIFFTLSLATGIIQCYASYVKPKEDIALGATSAGFMNEFIEVIFASAIVIPIAAGYLGLDWVKENAGFGMAFQTMPYLFERWGPILAPIGGVLWFGLLFFAGFTSSVAFGTPWVSFLGDEFGWSRKKSAWLFGLVVFLVGLPSVLFYNQGVLGEYDFWVGTITIFILGLFEAIAFVWILGIDKGWKEINEGADIKLPNILKLICKYVTPYLLILLFLGSLFSPVNNNWGMAFKNLFSEGWHLGEDSLIKKLMQSSLKEKISQTTDLSELSALENELAFTQISRWVLLILFVGICILVNKAAKRRQLAK